MGYSTDLTDTQWNLIETIFRSNKGQHFVEHSNRELINATLYLVKAGCQWHLLPNDFPPYKTVFSFYSRAVKSGKWEKAMDLMVKKTREDAGRKPTPTYGLIDSQSAKTTSASADRGFDGGKKVKGRKRHDDGYRKSFEKDVLEQLGLGVDISKRIKPEFEVLPLRWIVERTFSWENHSRRLSKDYEIKIEYEENMFMISHLHTLLRRY